MNNFVSKLICLSFLLFISLSTKLYSQQTTVSGNVTDGNEALIGVNILVKGKVIGTISDKDGNFSLNVNSAPPLTLVFSIVGVLFLVKNFQKILLFNLFLIKLIFEL